MNRRELTLGAAVSALAGSAVAQTTPAPAPAQAAVPVDSPYYDAFNAQLGRMPAAIQPSIRAF